MNFKIMGILLAGGLLLLGSYGIYQCSRSATNGAQQIPLESPERMERIRTMAENWPIQPDYTDHFNPIDPHAKNDEQNGSADKNSTATAMLPSASNGADELVTAYCSGCHSLDIVTQQHASSQRWKQILVWMEKKQNMPALPEKEEALILDYLSVNFGA